MIKQQDGTGTVIVTFRLPREVAAQSAFVAGDFNNWSTSSDEMSLEDDGFVIVIPLEAGQMYRFQYVLDGDRWENDWAADAYVPNKFGGADSVIDLTVAHHGTAQGRGAQGRKGDRQEVLKTDNNIGDTMTHLREVMTPNPAIFPATTTIADAARAMRNANVGDVLVERDGVLCGIVTDRDIVVRAVAEDRNPSDRHLGDICSRELTTLAPADSIEDAVRVMRDKALRRLPICDGDQPVGVVSLGDLAIERDPDSALADISMASPNS